MKQGRCPTCGGEVEFCPHCGKPVPKKPEPIQPFVPNPYPWPKPYPNPNPWPHRPIWIDPYVVRFSDNTRASNLCAWET